MSKLQAWLTEVIPGEKVLLSQRSLGHLLDDYQLELVPSTLSYARHVIHWKGVILPAMNLTFLLVDGLCGMSDGSQGVGAEKEKESASLIENLNSQTLLGVVAYRDKGLIKQGGLIIYSSPKLVDVPEESAELPSDSNIPWAQISSSCVEIEGHATPIIDLDRLFTQPMELPS